MDKFGPSGEKLGKGRPEATRDSDGPKDKGRRDFLGAAAKNTLKVAAALGVLGAIPTVLTVKESKNSANAMPKPGTNMTSPGLGEDHSTWERNTKEESEIVSFHVLFLKSFGKEDFKKIAEKKYPTMFAWDGGYAAPSRVPSVGKHREHNKAKYRVQDWINGFNKSNPEAKMENVEEAINNQIVALTARQKELAGKLSSQN